MTPGSYLDFSTSTSLFNSLLLLANRTLYLVLCPSEGFIVFIYVMSTLKYLPVIKRQRFLFISRRYFVLKKEDLNKNYLEDHQADHQTNGQPEKHKK